MSVVTSFTPDQDFWELNPQIAIKTEFSEFRRKDKSKGQSKSSSVMWWIALCYDMDRDNKWRGYKLADKQKELGEELLGSRDYFQKNKKELEPLIAAYILFTDTAAKRQLRSLEQKLDEKTDHLDSINYKNDPDGVDKMLASNEKHYKMLAAIQKQLSEEDTEGAGKGGSVASAADKGEV